MDRSEYTKQFFRNNRLTAVLAFGVFFAAAFLNIAASWYLQVIIDTVTTGTAYSFRSIVWMGLAIIGVLTISVTQGVIAYPKFLAKAMRQYKNYSFGNLLRKNIASFSKENTSTYISAFTNDVISIEDNYLKNIFQLVQLSMMFMGAFMLMFYYSVPMTLIVLSLAAVPMTVSILAGNRLARRETAVSAVNESYVATVKDILSGFSVVKSFNAESEVLKMYAGANAYLEKNKESRNRTSQSVNGISQVAYLVTQLGTLIIGAWMILNDKGGLTAGMLIGFTNLVNFVVQPIAEIPGIFAQRKAAKALIDKLAANLEHNVLDQGNEITKSLEKGIRLENVSYSYDSQKTVLKNISTSFEAGKAYAIVGGSGSGKSTLLNLLMGSDQEYEGSIYFDTNNLKGISFSSLYETVSMIQQNVFIFNATIHENITMFKDFTKEEVDRVIQLSGLDTLIAARGKDYSCGENGNTLSGGERQRVAIARTLLRNSSVLLVDEATSALDNETAHNITQAILNLSELTRIVVTHRLEENLLNQYDKILVLKNGELVEQGSFDDLMERKEYFYSLFMVSQ